MPTIARMHNIPPTKDWQEFEDITRTCLSIKWQSPNLTKNGRPGQAQDGVDIYGENHLGRLTGVQCKNTVEGIKLSTIEAEIENAEKFTPPITELWLATASPADTKIQQSVRLLSVERVKKEKFAVGLFFWDDLIQELPKNKEEFAKHYPDLKIADNTATGFRLLSVLDSAFYGLFLTEYMELIFGELGQMTNEDPQGFRSIVKVVQSCGDVLFANKARDDFSALCNSVVSTIYDDKEHVDWNKANDLAKEIQDHVAGLEYSLKGREVAVFRLGLTFGKWDTLGDPKELDSKSRTFINSCFQAILKEETLPGEITHALDQINGEIGFLRIGDKLYHELRGMIQMLAFNE